MQSFLQYHRFGRAVAVQVERDREKEAGNCGRRDRAPDSSISSSDTVGASILRLNHSDDTGDDEKAERVSTHRDTLLSHSMSISLGPPSEARTQEVLRPPMNRLATATTVKSIGTRLGNILTGIEVRKRTTKEGGNKSNVFVVGYQGENDKMNPQNWSRTTRMLATWATSFSKTLASQVSDHEQLQCCIDRCDCWFRLKH